MKFTSILALVSFALPALCAPIIDIEAQMTALGDSSIAFAGAITALSPTLGLGSIVQVQAIVTASASVAANLGIATAGTLTLTAPISDTEGIELLAYAQTVVPIYVDALAVLVGRKAEISGLLGIGLISPLAAIKLALTKVGPLSLKFNAAVAAHLFSASSIRPVVFDCITYVELQENLVGEWNELAAQLNVAHATAIAVYSA
ncbi:hypothetical protein C0991_010187 [Blastosporella zonata]|nr:hypothetical protein C0991_010187 [Blastosporella zonata]